MKHAFTFFAALTFPALLAAGPASAETVVKHKGHGDVVVKHEPGHPNEVIVKRPVEHRPHEFWHRGAWTVRIHGPAFRYLHGWGYRRWAVGAVLPRLLLTTDYYYDDYSRIGLQSPAPGYHWARYGNDFCS